jgi:large subunit ribosomal protein L25
MLTLTAEKREETGKRSKRLYASGKLPAVVYGPTEAATPIVLPLGEFVKVLKEAGESSVVELSGLGKPLQVLIHEVDRDPVTDAPRHVDLYAIEKGAKVEVAVPLEFVGESPAVKGGANLVKVIHELEIEADPANLPHEITVDISSLKTVGDQILVSDLTIPAGVEVMVEGEQVVALVQEVEVEEEASAAVPDMASIEVEKKGKEEEKSGE